MKIEIPKKLDKSALLENNKLFFMKKNVGKLDRTLRYIAAVGLVVIGLFIMGGIQGNVAGLVVALLSIIPALTATTRSCPLYSLTGISTVEKK
ncbi:MAG: DUF2892 domain-containing protein [Leptospiraceae bacterium]|nr:DUF2892 domain-containing protein [Leptospiraceae bacterium]MDW8305718.1 DUF2892 domain-containing protein [Leptospiraceae bacterium]